MASNPKFRPLPLVRGCHRQTVISTFVNFCRAPFSSTKYIALPDHDWLALEVSTPSSWKPDQPTVVMIHGVCGSHKSPYLIRMARKLAARGMRAVRLNLRGCGSGKGLSRKPYTAGCSDDVLCALKKLKSENPHSEIILMGFSLGGNIVLKLAGELAENGPALLKQVIAVSPPIDLVSSMRLIEDPRNRIYERYFVKLLVDDIIYRHGHFPKLPPVRLPKELRALDYDSLYLAPFYGFQNVFDYYRQNRSLMVVPNIAVCCHILFAEDDPIIDSEVLDRLDLPENIAVHKTKWGGHLGYLGRPGEEGGIRWLDSFLLKIIK